MKKYFSIVLLFAVTLLSCNNEFLNILPKDQLTEKTAFNTYDNFKTFAWSLYDYFGGYGNNALYPPSFNQEFNSDNLSETTAGAQSVYANRTKIVPASGATTFSLAISEWDFSYVRKVNLMMDNIDQSGLNQIDKDHWRSVAYFFRALRYYDLIAAFGDVPWVEHALSDTSKLELFGARTPRDVVAKNILDNLLWAELHIKAAGDGINTINVNVVRVLISRFGLFEGTWRKYRGLADANTYLDACLTASQKLMTSFPTVITSYDDVFNSEDLNSKAGIILFTQYVANLTDNALPRKAGSVNWFADMTKDAAESYLCADGRPISTSTVYAGNTTIYNFFRNRDRRLYFTVTPPYKVKVGSPNNLWTNTTNPADAEYITLMTSLGSVNKVLPTNVWNKNPYSGSAINQAPHFRLFNGGQAQGVSELGYFVWKFNNRTVLDDKNNSTNDCPLFRIEEVLLNYAEASWERGQFTQAIANSTINKLRTRANVPPMTVSLIDAGFDLKRDPTVDPLLWEIRRERRIELMADGFRFNDLKRWKKGEYFNIQALGAWVKNSDFGNKLKINGGGAEGYVEYFPQPTGWLDTYYLEPIPTQELVLNTKLIQNPGY